MKNLLLPALIMLRGLPGSGKSSLSDLLCENGKYPVFRIDDYFTDEKGDYQFHFENNHLAYDHCRLRTEEAMQSLVEKIFLDNTFTLEWEMEPYFKLAAEHNYFVFVLTVENREGHKNQHKITDEQVQKMAEKYKVVLL